MSEELKPCPFCGDADDLSMVRINDSTQYWRIECESCDYNRFIFGSKKEAIALWNCRPAEDALTERLELFRQTLAEVAKMAIDSEQEQIYEKCRDVLRDVYLEEVFKEKFDKILHGKDTDAPTKESEGEDE